MALATCSTSSERQPIEGVFGCQVSQYADNETGLHYNDRCYYDPDTSRYITQDLIGLAAATIAIAIRMPIQPASSIRPESSLRHRPLPLPQLPRSSTAFVFLAVCW